MKLSTSNVTTRHYPKEHQTKLYKWLLSTYNGVKKIHKIKRSGRKSVVLLVYISVLF